MADPGIIKVGPWAPDLTPINTTMANVIQNAVARADGYGPFQSLVPFTTALPGPCRGAFFARDQGGGIIMFAGTDQKLYRLDRIGQSDSFAWADVNGSTGGAGANKLWQFVQFNNLVIVVCGHRPSFYDMANPTEFTLLPGEPPISSHIAVVNQFVVLSSITSAVNRVQWCSINDPTQWTTGIRLADLQDLQDCGFVKHVAGGDNFGVIFQDAALRTMTFAPGSPVVFNIFRISQFDGLLQEYSVAQAGERIFYYSYEGFRMIVPGGGPPEAIGKEQVDRFFAQDFDQDFPHLFVGSADPTSTRVYWTYKSINGADDLIDKVLVYDYALKKWSLLVNQSLQYLIPISVDGLSGA